jgi:ubiquinone/menaquinone biosynthesis C-methylase UbiE
MDSLINVKQTVKEKYAEIALGTEGQGCCGPSSYCCGSSNLINFSMIGDDYNNIEGHVAEADLGLGCGLPTEYAGIKIGDTVVDLGSGAGNDVFIARSIVGEAGKVIGIDMTEEMIDKANTNNAKLDFKNVEFRLGDIEAMPVDHSVADVVVSNCVLNLVPNKQKAFEEIYRVLKSDGHFCVSDIVIKGELPENLKKSAMMYAGCVAGAIQQDDYLHIISTTGFTNVEIKKTKVIDLPDEILKEYLSESELSEYRQSGVGVFSITVIADKKL